MASTAALIFLSAILSIGLTIWGLFNRKRSILCAIGGLITTLGAALGTLYAWGEPRSVPWTTGYLVFVFLGLLCIIRQILLTQPSKDQAKLPTKMDG